MKIHGTAKGGAISKKDFGVAFGGGEAFIEGTGGTVTTDGDYKVHKFTSNGTFEITAGEGDNLVVEYLILGAGAGAGSNNAGGAGAGAFREAIDHSVAVQSYSIVVGAGSSGTAYNAGDPANGGDSSFDSITSNGGGFGGQDSSGNSSNGSGGGAGDGAGSSAGTGGTYGNDGGASTGSSPHGGGGGGGADQAGANASGSGGGNGGNGKISDIIEAGTDVYYCAGGGGAADSGSAGSGGTGGGGAGSITGAGADATNFGSGGGGGTKSGGSNAGGDGYGGLVVIRYQFQ